jgi:hypothetical protein
MYIPFIHCLEATIVIYYIYYIDDDFLSLFSSLNLTFYLCEWTFFSVYLLRVKKKKKEMGAGVLSLTDPFINRRLHTYKTCWISRNLSFTPELILLYILSYPQKKKIIKDEHVCRCQKNILSYDNIKLILLSKHLWYIERETVYKKKLK